ncbi:MAG: tripartite tricarboxylate transporter substrate binding protein [Treponema sp.]|nr:tripartite tricarboxylate transporter substrate binding protein [Treponema sp.]
MQNKQFSRGIIGALLVMGMVFAGCEKGTKSGDTVEKAGGVWKPQGTVTIYCPSAAGGSTDYCNRAMAQALSDYWGSPVQVINQTGGSGGVAAGTVWNAERNGLHLFGVSETVFSQRSLGVFDQPPTAWDLMPILNTVAVLSVAPNSPYKTIEDLIAAAKTKRINMASGTIGAVWTLKAVAFEKAAGIKFNHLYYEGSVPSQTAAMSGEVNVVVTGLAEQQDYLKAGRLVPLAVIETSPVAMEGIGTIRAVSDAVPAFAELPQPIQCIGIALPSDSPQEIRDAYQAAFIAAMQSKTIKDAIAARGFNTLGQYGAEAQEIAVEQEKIYSWALFDAGQAPNEPSQFGIERP